MGLDLGDRYFLGPAHTLGAYMVVAEQQAQVRPRRLTQGQTCQWPAMAYRLPNTNDFEGKRLWHWQMGAQTVQPQRRLPIHLD